MRDAARDLSQGQERGARGSSDPRTSRGEGEGSGARQSWGGKKEAPSADLAVPADTYPPPLPFARADHALNPLRALPPSLHFT